MFTPIINRIIYQPSISAARPDFTPAEMSIAYDDVDLYASDGVKVTGWYMKSPAPRGALLYLHGNAGDRRDWAQVAPEFVGRGYNLFILDYRGYGSSEGKPSEKGLYLDGEAAWVWLAERSRQDGLPATILGKSLGSGVASYLAAKHTPAGLILDSAFTAMRDLIAVHANWLPRFLTPNLFNSLARISQIACPTLIVHGDLDDLVPLAHGLALYRSLICPKALAVISGAGHNNIDSFDGYYRWIMGFLSRPREFVDVNRDVSDSALKAYLV